MTAPDYAASSQKVLARAPSTRGPTASFRRRELLHRESAPPRARARVQKCSNLLKYSVLRRSILQSRAPLGEREANIDRFTAYLNIACYVDLLKTETDCTKRDCHKSFRPKIKNQTGPVALYGRG